MFKWICPSCQQDLQQSESSWSCSNGHNFDRAKSGYINLLLAQHKSSKEPGDSKDMLLARRNFLNAGYYQKVAEGIAGIVDELVLSPTEDTPNTLLDCGCGEGYYLQQLASNLSEAWTFAGVDIAKPAVELAAKRKLENSTWVCASSGRLPLDNQSVDVALRVFSPPNNQEITRVLKRDGYLIVVAPAENHLIEIKAALYSELKPYAQLSVPEGFEFHSEIEVNEKIILDNNDSVRSLLSMTPFLWNGNRDVREELLSLKSLTASLHMMISCYRVNAQL